MVGRIIFALLALGALAIIAEGAIIGIRYVWLRPDTPWLFRLMLPGMFVGLALVLGTMAWRRAKARRSQS